MRETTVVRSRCMPWGVRAWRVARMVLAFGLSAVMGCSKEAPRTGESASRGAKAGAAVTAPADHRAELSQATWDGQTTISVRATPAPAGDTAVAAVVCWGYAPDGAELTLVIARPVLPRLGSVLIGKMGAAGLEVVVNHGHRTRNKPNLFLPFRTLEQSPRGGVLEVIPLELGRGVRVHRLLTQLLPGNPLGGFVGFTNAQLRRMKPRFVYLTSDPYSLRPRWLVALSNAVDVDIARPTTGGAE